MTGPVQSPLRTGFWLRSVIPLAVHDLARLRCRRVGGAETPQDHPGDAIGLRETPEQSVFCSYEAVAPALRLVSRGGKDPKHARCELLPGERVFR